MKKGAASMRNRISAWILTLVMIVGLVAVPAGEARAESVEVDLNPSTTSTTAEAKVGATGGGTVDVAFTVPTDYNSTDKLKKAGLNKLQVAFKVSSYTAKGDAGAQAYISYGSGWSSGGWQNLSLNTNITVTLDLSQYLSNSETIHAFGVQFANIEGSITYEIISAKLIGDGSQGGETEIGGNTSNEVTAKIIKRSGNADWAEFNYSVTNGTDSPISGIQIKVPATGTVNDLKAWGCSAQYSGGYIIIFHTKVLEAGKTYTCEGEDGIKFGFAGGASLGTPVVEFTYGEDGGGTSSGALNYELTGETKNVALEETPVGKHGKLSLKKVDGYIAPVIVDEHGNPFQLRGASTHGMHWEDAGGQFVNKGAFQSLRDEWGVNMVRLVSYVTQGGYTADASTLDTKIQTGVKAATELGMYVIIDWHIHAENPHDTKTQAEAFFKKYADKYKDYNNVIFEICNEPTGVKWYNNGAGGDLYSYCKDIATIIRDCGSKALIVCGTNTWSQDVDEVAQKPLKDDGFENILYTFHFYSGSHGDNLMEKVRTATKAETPIFVTEFGICDASGDTNFDTANADKWIELCDQNNISYCCWSLSNKNESASYLKPECTKNQGGWTEGDLATTGIWLVNTYRAHQDKEENTDTSKGEISVSISPQSGQLDAVAEGYSDPGSFVITVTNSGNKELTDLSAAFGKTNTSFAITKDFESTTLAAGAEATLEISLQKGKPAGIYSDSVIIKSGSMKKTLNIKQEVLETIEPVDSVTVSPEKLSMVKGDTEKLTATVLPDEATNKQVRWSSSAPEVAKVSADGTVTAVSTGLATVTATTVDGEKTATCTVTVTNPIKDFTIEPTEVSLYVGESETITVTPIPADADPYEVTWKSDAEGIAGVDADGKITANAKGTAKITATIGSITRTCNVTVSVPLKGIQFERDTVALKKGQTTELKLIPEPEGAIIKSVEYTSKMPSVATVSSEGKVTAVASGTTTITAESEGKTAECTVTVTTPVTGVKFIENADKIELAVNETFDLSEKYKIIPEDADNKEVSWSSSDKATVDVSEDGKVTAKEKTTQPVTITVTTVDGNYEAKCQVSVVGIKVKDITLEKDALSVFVGDTADLKNELNPTITPDDADNKTIIWKSSDTDVAEVDASGTLTAKEAGETVITAQAGNCTATCTVTVQKKTQEKPSVTLKKVSRTSDSITVSIALSSAQENTSGQLELSIDSGKSWEKVDKENQVAFSDLEEFTPYTVKARLAATDEYEASEPAEAELTVYTLVKDPYTVDVSKFANDAAEEYADALRTADNKEPTVAYDADKKELTLSEPGKEYTITGDNEDLTIVTGTGNYDMTLKNATVKEVEASAPGAVDMEIQGKVTVKDGVTASGDTDITIHGQSRQDTLTTPFVSTEGDLTVKQVTVEADAAQTEKPALAGDKVTIDDATVNAAGGTGKPAVKGNEVDLKNNPELQLKSDAGQKGIDAKDIVIEDKADVTFSGEEKDKYSVPPVDLSGNPYAEQKNPEEQKEPADDKIAITSITVSLPAATMEVGDTVKATATVQPANADNEVLWSGNNSNVLTVSDEGMVTAIAAGTADVIATAADGSGKSGRFTVTVVDTEEDEEDYVEATGLAVTASVKGVGEVAVKGTMKLALKKKLTLNVEFLPEDAEEEDVTFTSSNPKVAQVNDEGTVTGKKAGKAVITVKSDSGFQKTVKIQVMKKPVSKVKIKASKTTIKVKKTVKLKTVVTPNKKLASNGIFWKSSNPKIATVSASGVVKGVKKGKVKITAIATDGSGKKATVTIKIN